MSIGRDLAQMVDRLPDSKWAEELRYVVRDARRRIAIEERAQARPPLPCARCRVQDRKARSPYCASCDWTVPVA